MRDALIRLEMLAHRASCPCYTCVEGRTNGRMAKTPVLYPSQRPITFTLLPDAQVLAMKKEYRDALRAKLLELEADIKTLQDCAVEVS